MTPCNHNVYYLVELERTSVYDLTSPTIPSADYALLSGLRTLL